MDLKNKIQKCCGWDGLQLPTMINSDQLSSKYETMLQRTILDIFFISNKTSTYPTKISNVFVKNTFPSLTILCD